MIYSPEQPSAPEEAQEHKEADLEKWRELFRDFLAAREKAEPPFGVAQEALDPEIISKKTARKIERLKKSLTEGQGISEGLECVSAPPGEGKKITRHGKDTFNGYEEVPVDTLEVAQAFGIDLERPFVLVSEQSREEDPLEEKEEHLYEYYRVASCDQKSWLELERQTGPVIHGQPPYSKYCAFATRLYINPEKIDWLQWKDGRKFGSAAAS